MYQCFVRNDYDAVQSTAEMRLGGEFHFALITQTVSVVTFRLSALKTLITHLNRHRRQADASVPTILWPNIGQWCLLVILLLWCAHFLWH